MRLPDISVGGLRQLRRFTSVALVALAIAISTSGCSTDLTSVPSDGSASSKSAASVVRVSSIVGVVRDAGSQARMSGVRVQVAARSVVTDSSGRYRLASIPYGRISISFSAPGYVTYTRSYILGSATVTLSTVYLKREVAPAPVPAPTPTPTPPPTPPPAPTPPPVPAPAQLTQYEQQMVDLVNKERVANGLAALLVDMSLVQIAREHSQDMIDNNYFDHNSPTTGSPFDRLKAAGITYSYAGENIAGNQSVEAAHTSLMNSPGHKANILNPNYSQVGIGIRLGGIYGMYFTQLFVGKK